MKHFTMILLVAISLITVSNSQALQKELSFMFWFDHNPPTKNDTEFFIDAADAIDKLSANNLELEKAANKKGMSIRDNGYSERVLDALLSKNGIERDFFYDLEKVQLILMTRMFLNNCKVNNECTEGQAKQYSEQFVKFANTKTSENREVSRGKAVNAFNDAMLKSMVRWFTIKTIKGIIKR